MTHATKLQSTALTTAEWTDGVLTIGFTDGAERSYAAPFDIFVGLASAPSAGAYFNREVRPKFKAI